MKLPTIGDNLTVDLDETVAVVLLDRPRALNALTLDMLGELANVLRLLADDQRISVVVLTGAGRAFCAGVDLNLLQSQTLEGGRVGADFDEAAAAVTSLLEEMPKPTIAAVNGACFTGGLELALACDILIASDEAVIGDTHAKWGLRPTWGMSQRLIRRVGPARARWLSFTAESITGAEAVQIGLAVGCYPAHDLRDRVLVLARQIASNSPAALAAYKTLYALAENSTLREGLTQERALDFPIDDSRARIDAFSSRRGGAS